MIVVSKWLWSFSLMFALTSVPALSAERLVMDLSHHGVDIEYTFQGRDLLLFAAIDHGELDPNHPFDLIIEISGAPRDVVVRRKDRVAGIWVNNAATTLQDVPSYYAIAANRQLEDILSFEARAALGLGMDTVVSRGAEVEAGFVSGFIRNKIDQNLYLDESERLSILSNTLLRAEFFVPANIHEGVYAARVLLVQDGVVVGASESTLDVQKVGLARMLYVLANKYSALYGLLAVFIALLAGWGAGWIARERG